MVPSIGERIRQARRRKALSQQMFANMACVKLATLKDIESGRRAPRFQTIRKLASALEINPEDLITEFAYRVTGYAAKGAAGANPGEHFLPATQTKEGGLFAESASGFGILKSTVNPHDRVADYKNLFLEAHGDIFVSGTSMISFSEDSAGLIPAMVRNGSHIRLLIIDPLWIRDNCHLLSFLPSPEAREQFHLEVLNSIGKLRAIYESLPDESKEHYCLKSYRTIFPYIVTGFRHDNGGRCVVEITDYLPQRERPRFTLSFTEQPSFFDMVSQKFEALWNSDLTETVFGSWTAQKNMLVMDGAIASKISNSVQGAARL
jgi:transcriptional regulator with XRE-family HTH domain